MQTSCTFRFSRFMAVRARRRRPSSTASSLEMTNSAAVFSSGVSFLRQPEVVAMSRPSLPETCVVSLSDRAEPKLHVVLELDRELPVSLSAFDTVRDLCWLYPDGTSV